MNRAWIVILLSLVTVVLAYGLLRAAASGGGV